MNILVIDTCFAACMVGVGTISRVVPMDRGQSEALMPMVMDGMRDAGLTVKDIQLIVVNVGPGSFTGVRVGIAAARGLALGIGCPVQGVTSTDALYMARGNGAPAQVAIDTRRDDYFIADYQGPDEVPMAVSSIGVADAHAARAILDRAVVNDPQDYVACLGRLGHDLYLNGPVAGRGVANPIYIRDADVTVPKLQARGT